MNGTHRQPVSGNNVSGVKSICAVTFCLCIDSMKFIVPYLLMPFFEGCIMTVEIWADKEIYLFMKDKPSPVRR